MLRRVYIALMVWWSIRMGSRLGRMDCCPFRIRGWKDFPFGMVVAYDPNDAEGFSEAQRIVIALHVHRRRRERPARPIGVAWGESA